MSETPKFDAPPTRDAADGAGAESIPFGNWADRIERTTRLIRVQDADSYRAAMHMGRIDCLYDFEVRRLVALLRSLAATPQPAPDAMRTAIRSVIDEMIVVATQEDDGNIPEWTSENQAEIDKWQVRLADAIAAPVPPADGAGEFKTCPGCEMRQICADMKHCAGPSHAQLKERFTELAVALTECGWLIEKDDPPVYCVINPSDYDEHWISDANKALRFARKQDAQAYVDHIGWTSPPTRVAEHIWDDVRPAALPPSGTGAAEPVAISDTAEDIARSFAQYCLEHDILTMHGMKGLRKLIEKIILGFKARVSELENTIDLADKHTAFLMRKIEATPPVRGDREAIKAARRRRPGPAGSTSSA